MKNVYVSPEKLPLRYRTIIINCNCKTCKKMSSKDNFFFMKIMLCLTEHIMIS